MRHFGQVIGHGRGMRGCENRWCRDRLIDRMSDLRLFESEYTVGGDS